jgi:ribosomal protein L39E
MERCKTFLNSKIAAKKAELMKANAGRPKERRVPSYAVPNKKHKTHAHMR